MTAWPPHETFPHHAARTRSTGATWADPPPEGRRASNLLRLTALPAKRRELRMRRRTASPPSRCVPCALRASAPPSPTHTSSHQCMPRCDNPIQSCCGAHRRPPCWTQGTSLTYGHPPASPPPPPRGLAPRASRVVRLSSPTPTQPRDSHSPSPTVARGQARTPAAEKKKAGVTPASKPAKASAGKSATKVSAADGGGQG